MMSSLRGKLVYYLTVELLELVDKWSDKLLKVKVAVLPDC